jgi:hypothetical protein
MATSSRTRRPIWDRASTGLRQDLLHSLRALKKTPGLTIAVLITLAIGIGVNAAIFSIIDAVMLRPLPYPRGDRIVTIWEKKPNGQPNSMTTLNYLDYAKQSTVFERIAATTNCCAYVTLADGGAPMLVARARLRVVLRRARRRREHRPDISVGR